MGRGGNRTQVFLIFVILSTIPCYLLGIGLWLFSPDNNAPSPTLTLDAPDVTATWTQIVLTQLTNDNISNFTATWTPIVVGFDTATPTQSGFQQATATLFFPPTVTRTPTNTPFVPTNTPIVPPTATATPTIPQPVLLPASDTPAP